jgi:hypothetical protein
MYQGAILTIPDGCILHNLVNKAGLAVVKEAECERLVHVKY